MDIVDNDLIKRVIYVRENAGYNQAKLAKALNLTRSTISLNESGKRGFSKRTLRDIADYFDVNYEWLLNGEGEPYNEGVKSVLAMLQKEYTLDELDIEIIKKYLDLSPIERQVFKDFIKK